MGEESNNVPNQCWSKLFSLAQSVNTGNSTGKQPMQISEQDRKFVEDAMSEAMHLTNPTRQMSKLIAELKMIEKPRDDDKRNVKIIVEELEDLVCDVDCAIDFCKLSGLDELMRLLKSDCDPVRIEMARLIPSLAQNNPYVQDVILETDLLSYLLVVLKDTSASEKLRAAVLSGISSVVRSHEKAFSYFCERRGLETILDVFQQAIDMDYARLSDKAVSVTTSIAHSLGPEAKNYDFFSILLRMLLQLPQNGLGYSHGFDYLMDNIIVGKEMEEGNSTNNDGCTKKYAELDSACKSQFRELLEKHLKYEEGTNKDSLKRVQEKLNMVVNEDMRWCSKTLE